ncbi:MAG: AAA family ATPase [Candidatus Cloacimonetes bacterium]|nr:AAA family ATPase [Candidatus Cloacimonadota bacterium]
MINTTNGITFPTLNRIRVIGFSLYMKDIDYTFIDGINLVIGGNGMGKTTFINILRYALIGAYRTHTRFERTYDEKRIIRRKPMNAAYFQNRMKTRGVNENSVVILDFSIGPVTIEITRSLYEHMVKKVVVTENGTTYLIDGEKIIQGKYDQMITSLNNIKRNKASNRKDNQTEMEIENLMQYKYESLVSKLTGLTSFDAFIFFVINIFIFDEERATIFWEDKNASDLTIQEYLTAYLLSDLSTQLEELSFEAKYLDSRIRHLSEEKKPLQRLLDEIYTDKTKKGSDTGELLAQRDSLLNRITQIDDKRSSRELEIKSAKSQEETISFEITTLNEKCESTIDDKYQTLFGELNEQYNLYLRMLRDRHTCPLCKSAVDIELSNDMLEYKSCFLCGSQLISQEHYSPEVLNELISMKTKLHANLQAAVNTRGKKMQELDELDVELRKLRRHLSEVNQQVRDKERLEIKDKTIGLDNEYNAIFNKITEIEDKMEKRKKEKNDTLSRLNILNHELNQKRTDFTQKLSSTFTKYAELFIPNRCRLQYSKSAYNTKYKCYIPVIGGIPRYAKNELSESQAFFIEQSFRLSFLDNFYSYKAFFIFETPDSSLDVAFSRRAADTLLLFLDKPNSLIVTFNYGNSDFLRHITQRLPKHRIGYLDMIEYGYQSETQQFDEILEKARNQFLEMI